MEVIHDQNTYSTQAFIDVVNKLRLANKDKWYAITCQDVNGKTVNIKGYNTWLQIFTVNAIDQCTCMDISVKEFKATLERGLK